jgi:hypothetical protein
VEAVSAPTHDTFARDLAKQLARVVAYTITVTGALALAIGFTILPSLSDTATQLLGMACGLVGLAAAWTIEIWRSARH